MLYVFNVFINKKLVKRPAKILELTKTAVRNVCVCGWM